MIDVKLKACPDKAEAMRSFLVLLVLVLGLATAAAADLNLDHGHAHASARKLLQSEAPEIAAAKAAADFCKSPDIKKLSCGWATEDELGKTSRTCNLCGTVWGGEVTQLPHEYKSFNGMYYKSPRFVSLACRPGKLLVRAVFKMLDVPSGGKVGGILNPAGVPGTLGSKASPVRRCDLELPPYENSKSEVEAALRSKEVNCKTVSDFIDLKAGQWYSDTATFDFSGCEGVKQKGAEYIPTMPYITHNPGPGFLLAKFEVQEA